MRFDLGADAALHHQVNVVVLVPHVGGRLMPKLPVREFGGRRPGDAVVVGPNDHQIALMTEYVERLSRAKRAGMAKRKITSVGPCAAAIVGCEDLALPPAALRA